MDKTPPNNSPDTLMEFPCDFTIKTMGLAGSDFELLAFKIVQKHCPQLEKEKAIRTRLSKSGKYVSVSITLIANSKIQLDVIYQELTDSEHVLMSL